MSIYNQALFWFNSVNSLTSEVFEQADLAQSLIKGMTVYTELLRNIYGKYEIFEFSTAESVMTKIGILKDDLENYHNLTDTTLCIYGLVCAGTVVKDGNDSVISVDKVEFRNVFKKPAKKYFDLLEQFGFSFSFTKNGTMVKTFSSADTIKASYHVCPEMLDAMKYLSDRLPENDVKRNYADSSVIFRLADYESLVLQKSAERKSFSPLHQSIMNVLGQKRELWIEIVRCLGEDIGLQTDVSLKTYVFPNWVVKFLLNKKTICTFHIQYSQIYLRLPLSYQAAKYVIDNRSNLPKPIQNSIQGFGCVGCGKCVDRSNLEDYKGVPLCKLSYTNFVTEDSRMVQFEFTCKEELDAVSDIIQNNISHRRK